MKALVFSMLCAFGLALAAPALAAELKVGDPAPEFTLQASDGKTYKLSDFKGKQAVVIAWFPRAFTQGCTIECKSLAENGDKIKKYNVEYFMASVDPLEKNVEFAKAKSVDLGGTRGVVEKKEADFPILSDPTKETANAYGVIKAEWGAANRWTFYIDTDGRIAAIDKAVKAATAGEDMVAKLAELKVATRGD